MKTLIVTGGAGFIGTNLIKTLLKKTNHKIISIDNYSSGYTKNHINHKRVKYIKGETNDIHNLLNKHKKQISTIFHFGEFSRIFSSFSNYEKCFNSNITGTWEVIKFAFKNKIKLIYSATSASLGNNSKDQHLSPYSWSKAKNLDLIINLNKWFKFKYEVIYFYNVYGQHQILNGKMAAVIGIFEKCFRKKKPLPVVYPGTQTRKFTHVEETVNAVYLAWKNNKNRHYSVTAKKSLSIIKIAKLFGGKIKFIKKRKGERFKSTILKHIRGIPIQNLYSTYKLNDYIKTIVK